jgi:predicted MFS family arabinose efflux permease
MNVLPSVPRAAWPPAWAVAGALALGAAVSLGLARFSYALLLPPMRHDLGWNYTTAGAMNTVNAAGYLLGALLTQRWLQRHDARHLLVAGSAAAAVLLAAHGFVLSDAALVVLRLLTGVASAATFVAGGLMAAALGQSAAPGERPLRAGLALGLYYGGTGVGIIVSALLVPAIVESPRAHAWQAAWIALGAAAAVCAAITWRMTRHLSMPPVAAGERAPFRWGSLRFGLLGYLMFGLGYIGYMTFIVTLLREQGVSAGRIVGFYALLGAGVIASSWLWAGLLQRHRGGRAMAWLNGVLAVATLLPVLTAHPLAAFASAALFGGVFLSVVASTTAMVRHNLPTSAWPAGISAFTIVFALGQIVGPTLVGRLADGPGGLARGLATSALVLALGALLASRQKALPPVQS